MPDQPPSGAATTSAVWDGDVLRLAIVGRLAAADIELLSDRLAGAPGRCGVVFDRSRLGAPTAAGREALERWAADELPVQARRVAAWADVYDERRFRSLTRDGRVEGRGPGYPQRVFADLAEAEAWVRARLAAVPGD